MTMQQKAPIKIARYNLAGKRRMVIYLTALAEYSQINHSILHQALLDSQLRENTDWVFNPKTKDIALSLASAQAIVLTSNHWANTDKTTAWHTWHAITDYIQGI